MSYTVAGHEPPYKRIDTTHPGRRRVITKEMVQNGTVREPDLAVYKQDWVTGNWTLKE